MLLALLCDILIFVIIQVKYNDYVSVLDVTEISYATSVVRLESAHPTILSLKRYAHVNTFILGRSWT